MPWLFVRTSRTSVVCTHSGVSQSPDKGFSTLRNVGSMHDLANELLMRRGSRTNTIAEDHRTVSLPSITNTAVVRALGVHQDVYEIWSWSGETFAIPGKLDGSTIEFSLITASQNTLNELNIYQASDRSICGCG